MTEAQRTAYSAGKKLDIVNVPSVSGSIPVELIKTLWVNPSPTSAFAVQTIALNSDDYDFLFIDYSMATTADYHITQIFRKGDNGTLSLAYSTGQAVLNSYRIFTTNSSSIYFDNCYWVTSSDTNIDNNRNIPIAIYGLKSSVNVDMSALVANVSTSASKCMLSDGETSVEDALASKSQIKFKVVTGTTDATANLVIWELTKQNAYVLSGSGTSDGTGSLTNLSGGIPMTTADGNWFIHVYDYAGAEVKNTEVSLKVAYVEL
jgi:hypothetical protein